MSDKTTLLPCPFCGGEAHISASSDGYGVECWSRSCIDMQMEEIPTEAEAIAAWNTRTHGTLTAEQVREAVKRHATFDCGEVGVYVSCASWQAIADELNAELGSETCEVKYDLVNGYDQWTCSSCRESWVQDTHLPTACPNCGRKVVGE